jgi:hypothetical protein
MRVRVRLLLRSQGLNVSVRVIATWFVGRALGWHRFVGQIFCLWFFAGFLLIWLHICWRQELIIAMSKHFSSVCHSTFIAQLPSFWFPTSLSLHLYYGSLNFLSIRLYFLLYLWANFPCFWFFIYRISFVLINEFLLFLKHGVELINRRLFLVYHRFVLVNLLTEVLDVYKWVILNRVVFFLLHFCNIFLFDFLCVDYFGFLPSINDLSDFPIPTFTTFWTP